MQILAASDLHGADDTYAWLVEQASGRGASAIILAGDLLNGRAGFASIEEAQEHQAQVILDILETSPCPVLYIMGNDDVIELPHRSERIIALHGRRWDTGRFNFVGYQYSLPFIGGLFERPEEEIAVDLQKLAPLVDKLTILVTHSPAFGILDMGILDRHAGSMAILHLVQARRPRIHIHGHIHRRVGRDGIHWNVATALTRRAVLIDLETLEDEVIVAGPGRGRSFQAAPAT